jgi:hypothetical protein
MRTPWIRLSALGALALTVAAASAVMVVPGAAAHANVNRLCLESNRMKGLFTSTIVRDLGLTGDQLAEMRGRLAMYLPRPSHPFNDFGGLGLTGDQIAEMKRRIAAQMAEMYKHPLGWPCAPFTHRQRVIQFVRSELIYNGFRPAMSIWTASPRQIQFRAIQDGIEFEGVAVKTGSRRITIHVETIYRTSDPGTSDTETYTLRFTA